MSFRTSWRTSSRCAQACVECAAIGVADEKQGEAIKVFVVKNDPILTEEMWPSTAGRT